MLQVGEDVVNGDQQPIVVDGSEVNDESTIDVDLPMNGEDLENVGYV